MGEREDTIRKAAYRLWEEDGRPDGMDKEHWFRASRDVEAALAKDVRAAGRKSMRNPPEEWDKVDEQIDESFPASDPSN